MPGLRLSRRERRTVIAGALISVASLTLVFGVLPLERRWSLREDRIAAGADRLARLRYLVAHENDLRRELGVREGVSSSEGARILIGRTPAIAVERKGRDHWANAWSLTLAGCGVPGGAVVGKTSADGTAVVDRRVTPADLHHTYYRLLGVDPGKRYHMGSRPVYLADEKAQAIQELVRGPRTK